MDPFPALGLRRLALSHAGELVPFFERFPQPLSGYTTGMLAAWDPVFHYSWARPEPDAVVISCLVEPDSNRHLIQPVGTLSPTLQADLVAGAARLPYALKIYGVCERFLADYPHLVERFEVVEEPIASNYIYSAEDLALLAGRKFAAKRNHIAQAAREFQWSVEPLKAGDADEAVALARALFEESSKNVSLARDVLACEVALRNLEVLHLRGTGIRVQGKIIAFALWEALHKTTAVVHFERAVRNLKGAYQIVNQETAKVMLKDGIQFINREEDLGDPGLQKAKQSYHPVRIEKAFTLTFRRAQVSA